MIEGVSYCTNATSRSKSPLFRRHHRAHDYGPVITKHCNQDYNYWGKVRSDQVSLVLELKADGRIDTLVRKWAKYGTWKVI